jgi:hypothetical protein
MTETVSGTLVTHGSNQRRKPEMIEGKEAFDRFRDAVRVALTVPKSALPPSPFGKARLKRKKPTSPKG